jgi:hypothetical protein
MASGAEMFNQERQEKGNTEFSPKILPSVLFRASYHASKSYSKELTYIVTFFMVVVTVSNFLYGIFHFALVPIFEVSFNSFHTFCQLIVQCLIYSWLIYIISSIFYHTMAIISIVFPIVPWWPKLAVPGWVVDIALLSAAITRVFQATDLIVPRSIRAEAESEMTPVMWNDIHAAEGSIWGPIHRSIEGVNAGIWALVDGAQIIMVFPIRRFILQRHVNIIRQVLIVLAGFVFMWEYIRLSGYFVNLLNCWRLSSPLMRMRKKLFKFFCANLVGALAVSGIFFVVNGWAVDSMKSYMPVSGTHSWFFLRSSIAVLASEARKAALPA